MATLLSVRTQVRNRLRLSTQDPLFTDAVINRQISLAYSGVTTAQPNGWWWQHTEQTIQNGNAQVDAFPVRLATPDNSRVIRKVYSVFVSMDGVYWLRVDTRERTDQIRLAGGRRVADGIPLSWTPMTLPQTVAGNRSQIAIVFDPPLPALYWVRFIGVADPPDVTADGDVLVGIPNMLVGMVIDTAVAALATQRRAVGVPWSRRRLAFEKNIAQASADGWLHDARVYFATAVAGAGYATQNSRHG